MAIISSHVELIQYEKCFFIICWGTLTCPTTHNWFACPWHKLTSPFQHIPITAQIITHHSTNKLQGSHAILKVMNFKIGYPDLEQVLNFAKIYIRYWKSMESDFWKCMGTLKFPAETRWVHSLSVHSTTSNANTNIQQKSGFPHVLVSIYLWNQ